MITLKQSLLVIAVLAWAEASLIRNHRIVRSAGHYRIVRQTLVASNGSATGTGDNVTADASAYHYKNPDGQIGMNVTSTGNATGANASQINNTAAGQVGGMNIGATGNINGAGQNTNIFSDIFGEIYGQEMSMTNNQKGTASGTGDTQVVATGDATMTKDGVISPSSSNNSIGQAGATGSDNSLSETSLNQILTWDQLIAQLYGHAVGSGKTNAQANVDLGAGNQNTGVEVNGLVSGLNNNGGQVNAEVTGNGAMTNSTHELNAGMNGNVTGDGPSQLVGATNLQSNKTGTNLTISAFGDAKADVNGTNAINMNSDTSASRTNGASGQIDMSNTANASRKNMTVQNGLQVNDANGGTLAIGYGEIKGNGTENSNANITVNSKYNADGQAQVDANGVGSAVSKEKNSTLNIDGNAVLNNGAGKHTGDAGASGTVMGAQNNLTGTGHVTVNNNGSSGTATMEANGGGPGSSAAQTNANLTLNDNGTPRTSDVSGNVVANGDQTQVKSFSTITDENGVQSLENYQHATSNSQGASSASASNSGWLKRRKRASQARFGALFDILF